VVAVALAGAAFALVLWAASRGHLSVRAIVVLGIGCQLAMVVVPLVASSDVRLYAIYGRIQALHHANPYRLPPSSFAGDPLYGQLDPLWRHLTAPYGPAFVMASARFVRLFHSQAALILAFKALAASATIGATLLVNDIARRLRPERAAVAVAAFAVNPVTWFVVVGSGHNDALLALAMALALWLWLRTPGVFGQAGATAALTVGALVKFPVAVALALAVPSMVMMAPRGRRLVSAATHIGVMAAVATPFLLSFGGPRAITSGLSGVTRFGNFLAPTSFLRTAASAAGAGPLHRVIEALYSYGPQLLLVAAFAVILSRGARRGSTPASLGRDCAILLLLWVLLQPQVWPWYLIWFLPLAWLLPNRVRAGVIGLSLVLPVFLAGSPWGLLRTWLVGVGKFGVAPALLAFSYVVVREIRQSTRRRRRESAGPPSRGVDGYTEDVALTASVHA
jgi:hypothetical protein